MSGGAPLLCRSGDLTCWTTRGGALLGRPPGSQRSHSVAVTHPRPTGPCSWCPRTWMATGDAWCHRIVVVVKRKIDGRFGHGRVDFQVVCGGNVSTCKSGWWTRVGKGRMLLQNPILGVRRVLLSALLQSTSSHPMFSTASTRPEPPRVHLYRTLTRSFGSHRSSAAVRCRPWFCVHAVPELCPSRLVGRATAPAFESLSDTSGTAAFARAVVRGHNHFDGSGVMDEPDRPQPPCVPAPKPSRRPSRMHSLSRTE